MVVHHSDRTAVNRSPIRTIAFDADDTLWRHQDLFETTQARFFDLLRDYHDENWIAARLHDAEMRNLRLYGYGVKGFMLSMVETAIELTEGRIGGADIQRILDLGKGMLDHPLELMPGAAEVLAGLEGTYELLVITKGDLFDQETKVARSGLGAHFKAVEVVSEKDAASYAAILKRHGIGPAHFLMVGNSLKSDILPVLEVGGRAVHVPYELQWSHDQVQDVSTGTHGYVEIASLAELPGLLEDLEAGGGD